MRDVKPCSEAGGAEQELELATASWQVKRRYALDWSCLAAFAIYLCLAFLFFARGLIGRFSTAFIGNGPDPPQFMWLLAWWPHAIRLALNPLYSQAIWAPRGVSLAWTMNTPLLSVAAIPAVLGLGAVATYNVLCLLAVALAGWCAFLLCRYITDAYWPSLIGGYIFGFSAYMLGHALAHLNLLLVFPVPLFAWLVILRFRENISRRAFVAWLTLLLITQFLLFVELYATMAFFAALAFTIALIVGARAEKSQTLAILPDVALSYAIGLVLVGPYIYYMFACGYEPGALHPPLLYSTDLLSLFIPTPTAQLGRMPAFQAVSSRFLGYIYENGGYLGLPLALIAGAFAWGNWSKGWARLLVVFFVAAVAFSLGPLIIAAGHPLTMSPGAIFTELPLIGKALPARLMVYAFLALALIAALWLSSNDTWTTVRMLGALAVVGSTLPNLSANFWTSALRIPPFFSEGFYTKYLQPNETVIALPYGMNAQSMAWQFTSGWYFRMAGGYTGNPPLVFRRWPAVRALYRVSPYALPDAGDQLRAFLAVHRAYAVLVDDREAKLWQPLMATLGVTPVQAGGITLYRVSPAELATWRNATATEMETRAAHARFAALLTFAEASLEAGSSPASLTPTGLVKASSVPPGWVLVPEKVQPSYADGGFNTPRHPTDPHFCAGMYLAAGKDGNVEVGVAGWYLALRQVVDEYRADAIAITPHDLAAATRGPTPARREMLIMTFSPGGLKRAAAHSRVLVHTDCRTCRSPQASREND